MVLVGEAGIVKIWSGLYYSMAIVAPLFLSAFYNYFAYALTIVLEDGPCLAVSFT
jgi:hypothetical protein